MLLSVAVNVTPRLSTETPWAKQQRNPLANAALRFVKTGNKIKPTKKTVSYSRIIF